MCLFFFVGALENSICECPPNDETTLNGPSIGRRSVLGYDQSGHIPNANPNDPEVILWSGKQRSKAGRNGTLWSAPGFGPGTFGYGEDSQVHGEVSPFEWTFVTAPGFEPGTLIRTRRIGTRVGTGGVSRRLNGRGTRVGTRGVSRRLNGREH